MSRPQEAVIPAPSFTLDATDPLSAGLLRYWIGAAKAHGGYPPARIRAAELKLKEIQAYRQKYGKRR